MPLGHRTLNLTHSWLPAASVACQPIRSERNKAAHQSSTSVAYQDVYWVHSVLPKAYLLDATSYAHPLLKVIWCPRHCMVQPGLVNSLPDWPSLWFAVSLCQDHYVKKVEKLKEQIAKSGTSWALLFFSWRPATARRCISIWHVWHVFLINHLAWRTVTHFVFPGDSASLQIHCSFSTVVQHWRHQKLGQNILRLKRFDLLQSLSHKTCSLDARHALVQKLNRNEQKKHDSQQDGFFVL